MAALKIRQYKKNLKYAIWDYQDGKEVSEAAKNYRLAADVVEYSISFALRETGQTVAAFRENKDQEVDTSSKSRPADYEERLRRGVAQLKSGKASRLLPAASQLKVGVFDLAEKLAREVEIDGRLRRLQPVEISLDCEMLSDIDEVIRDDSAKTHVAAAAIVASEPSPPPSSNNGEAASTDSSATASNSSSAAAKVETNEVTQMVVEVCDVCTRVFLDHAAYRDHVTAGCNDY